MLCRLPGLILRHEAMSCCIGRSKVGIALSLRDMGTEAQTDHQVSTKERRKLIIPLYVQMLIHRFAKGLSFDFSSG